MIRHLRHLRSDERGSVLAMVAVSLVAVMSMMALAVDLAMLYTAHAEAQRTADAAALAGAQVYRDETTLTQLQQVALVKHMAKDYAARNYVRGPTMDTTLIRATAYRDTTREVIVETNPDNRTVRVTISRQGIGLWFANLLGLGRSGVRASAVAQASQAGGARCLVPIAMPDLWKDNQSDANNNRTWDPGEEWTYDPGLDSYQGWNGTDRTGDTGYGSALRNPYAVGSPPTQYSGDLGRLITIKPQRPNQEVTPSPGWFFPWRIGESKGAADYKDNFSTCNPEMTNLGTNYDLEMGNMVGPTKQAVDDLMKQDKNATWDQSTQTVKNSQYPDWKSSPRVIKVALFDPNEMAEIAAHWQDPDTKGSHNIKFNNFALLWLEGLQGAQNDPYVAARFLWYATGTGGGPTVGSLPLYLRLIK